MLDDILTLAPPPADARVAYASDANQFLDLRRPSPKTVAGPRPLVVNIHGGFWRARYDLGHAGHLCAALTAKGLATANLEYRRVGNAGGGWPGTFEDLRAAYNFLVQNARKYNLDLDKMVVMGHSAGGQLALCLAAHESAIGRAVSLAGVVDLEHAYQLHLSHDAVVEFLGGTPAQVPEHYREADPMRLSIPQAQQRLIHGSADEDVPPEFSRDYVAAKQKRTDKEKEDARLVAISGASHLDLIDPRTEAWKTVEKTVLSLLL
jgi:acetyl esterase/lipase